MSNCKQCNTVFEFADADLKVHQKMNVPPPTLCPDCRNQRRCAWRNDKNYYRNTCFLCQKNIVSLYSPDKPFKVLCPSCFWSDRWNPLEHGKEFDFSRPFFDQFKEMRAEVPRLAMFNTQSENSDYTAHSSQNRNCFMGSSLVDCEDVHYSDYLHHSKDSMDCSFCLAMEMCYQCLDCHTCVRSNYLQLCSNMKESFFAFDCRGCDRVIGCVSLRNRKNHILNQPAGREECIATVQRLKNDPVFFREFKSNYEALKASLPKRDAWMINTEKCTGNYINNSKNVRWGFTVDDTEDARYIFESLSGKDLYDVTRVRGEFVYEGHGIVDLKFGKCCNLTYQSDNVAYCDNCQNAHFCFGCMGLKQHQFCALNKQYSEKEYKELVPKIIAHMRQTEEYGEFFPVTLSPFGYNETKAQEFYPLTQEEVLRRGWKWSDYEAPVPPEVKSIPAHRLPDTIKDIPDDILNWAILCEADQKPFKIAPQELKFYRTKGLPIPHRCHKHRHYDRMLLQNSRKLYDRICANCERPIHTTYAPDRSEKVVCEGCYLKIVY